MGGCWETRVRNRLWCLSGTKNGQECQGYGTKNGGIFIMVGKSHCGCRAYGFKEIRCEMTKTSKVVD